MKRNANYKMSKRLKTMLALMNFTDAEERARFRNKMINAEVYAAKTERVNTNKTKSVEE
jgi:hypothetical protein